MEDITKANWWSNLKRLAEESRPSVLNALLKIVGLASHEIRCNLATDTFPVKISGTRSGGLFDEGYWRLPVRPADLEIQCVSNTEIFVDSVTVFAEIDNDSFQFLETSSPKVVSWTEQLGKQDLEGTVTLPKLQPGVSRRVQFTAVERIGPKEADIVQLLSRANAEKEAVLGALVIIKLGNLQQIPSKASSSTELAFKLSQLDDLLTNVPEQLRVTAVVTLHDGTAALFGWNNGRFEKDFFTGGITTA